MDGTILITLHKKSQAGLEDHENKAIHSARQAFLVEKW